MLKNRIVPLFAAALIGVGAAACAEEPADQEFETIEPAEEAPAIAPETEPGLEPGLETEEEVFDPALDVNNNGVLDPDEGLGDADGDGILDRDEEYVPPTM